MLWQLLLFGALGGAARGLLGYSKYIRSYSSVKFNWKYFSTTVGISLAVGAGAVWVIKESGMSFEGFHVNNAIAVIIGYAGGDAVENLYRTVLKKPVVSKKDLD